MKTCLSISEGKIICLGFTVDFTVTIWVRETASALALFVGGKDVNIEHRGRGGFVNL